MSRSIRLNASWALTHAAMSLLRDRYEQFVRFSWLARQPDQKEFEKFLLHFYAKTRSLLQNIPEKTREEFSKILGPLPQWATEKITKEQSEKLRQWEALNLRAMATKRDGLAPFTELPIGQEKIADWYDSIYAQFSSVSHFDMYSIEMLGLHKAPNGQLVLAASPYWPGLLILLNCLLDILQCFESAYGYFGIDAAETFNGLFLDWFRISRQMNLNPQSLHEMSKNA